MILALTGLIFAWPIITALVFVAVMLLLLTCEREIIAGILLIGMITLIFFGMTTDLTIVDMLKYAGIYVGIGVVFTFVKWYFWAQKMGRKYNNLKETFRVSGSGYSSFAEYWNSRHSKDVMMVKNDPLTVYYKKPALVYYLTNWILNWPFYAMLLAIEDFIVEIVNWFADRVGKSFSNIATKAFNA